MSGSPLLLALDTSTSTASLALFDGHQVVSETTWLAGREHSTRLLVEIEIALERVARRSSDITGLVVARGPGSFTGVRVALSVAKGMAAALGIPAWGVSSLDVLALAAASSDLPVRAALQAGRGRYATALYAPSNREPHAWPRQVEPPRLATVEQLLELMAEATLVIGELTPADRAVLDKAANARLAPRAAGARRAGFVAELGGRLAQFGDPGDPSALDALYIT